MCFLMENRPQGWAGALESPVMPAAVLSMPSLPSGPILRTPLQLKPNRRLSPSSGPHGALAGVSRGGGATRQRLTNHSRCSSSMAFGHPNPVAARALLLQAMPPGLA
jgi:hypothetical protein